jgi:hypothetical protein
MISLRQAFFSAHADFFYYFFSYRFSSIFFGPITSLMRPVSPLAIAWQHKIAACNQQLSGI